MPNTIVEVITPQQPWTIADASNPQLTDTGSLSAPGAFAHKTGAVWSTVTTGTNAQRFVVTDLTECNSLALKFFGEATGTAPYQGLGVLWGISKFVQSTITEYMADFLCEFELTLGTTSRDGNGGILPNDVDFVKTINVVKDRSLFPGVRIIGQEAEAPAVMLLDAFGYWGLILELRCKLPTGASGTAMTDIGSVYRVA